MVIGDDFSVALHEKAGTKDVNLEMGPRAAVAKLHHAFVVDQWLASSVDGDLNGMAGLRVTEFDDDVEQADAGAVSWTTVSAISPSLSSSFKRCCVSASWRFRESASAPPAEATFSRRSSDSLFRESRVVDADCDCTSSDPRVNSA